MSTINRSSVFLVVDCMNAPGRVYAVFADRNDAVWFADALEDTEAEVEERTVFYGQPSVRGYNP